MWTTARRTAVLISFLAGCAGIVGESERDYSAAPVAGENTGGDDSGAASGASGAGATGIAADGGVGSTGATGGAATGATGGAATGATGATTGGATGTSNGFDAGASSGVDAGPATPGTNQTDPCGNGTEALTKGLRIREISLYQVVKIPLMTNGTWAAIRNSPVVQGKKALVRAFVDTLSGYTSHAVRAVLTLDNGGTPKQIPVEMKPSAASTDAALGSTFNFNIEPADIGPNTKMSVSLVDPTCTNALGAASDARFPASGTQALAATKIGKLRVVVVPVNVGSLKPDTSAAQLKNMRDALIAHYPIPDAEITVRSQAITGPSTVTNNDWSNILNQVLNARNQDNPPDDVYYYGIMTPASSFGTYCRSSCLLGLAPLTTRVSPDQQGGLGVGFLDEYTSSTIVHELGHAHGRAHAPCGGVSGADSAFPYSGGGTGVWGWNSLDNTLQNPSSSKDVMGYCDPAWMSDYTYKAIGTRSSTVNIAMRASLGQGPDWHSLLLYADGSARWGGMHTKRLPAGDVQLAQVLDVAGQVIDEVEVVRVALDHVDDALLYIPEPELGWHSLKLGDRTLTIADVANAL